jgi:hypothetical protein
LNLLNFLVQEAKETFFSDLIKLTTRLNNDSLNLLNFLVKEAKKTLVAASLLTRKGS